MANDDPGQESDTNRVGTGDPWDFDNPLLAANYADNSDQEYRCNLSVVSYMHFMENLEREKEEQQAPKETQSTLVVLHNQCYTGPWFKKIGTKIQPRYLESDVDLDELVQGFKKYLEELKKKYKVDSAGEIVLMNMNDERKGSKHSGSVLQNATKPTSYTGLWFKKIGTKIQLWYLKSDVDLDELVQGFKKYLEELKKKCKVDSAGETVLMNMNDEWKGSKHSGSVLQNATKPTSAAEVMKGDLNTMLAPHIKEIK
ncbi:hypothetical protein A7U60_g1537 [Sanghuangporus baumii]|uniref:Uncharacterized protein n=1 Tax=Sanghuangporus baumii TaxID=108892 RepID=A0A9Q5N933_SANBA|nr:hypothetical protein A7U60_g1537 [Sanghuangporus baumii]